MGKAELRAAIRARRAAGHQPSSGLVQRVLAHVPHASVVCCYVAGPGEPPTSELIQALLTRGDSVFLPVACPGGALEWVNATAAKPWLAWGLPGTEACAAERKQLPDVDVVIVPALAVTEQGERLGQGGGYYDRFLVSQRQARTIALVWSDELVPDVFAQAHDVSVDTWVVADG
jgi:5-formyltetrahydrofolate cyclo-ligase